MTSWERTDERNDIDKKRARFEDCRSLSSNVFTVECKSDGSRRLTATRIWRIEQGETITELVGYHRLLPTRLPLVSRFRFFFAFLFLFFLLFLSFFSLKSFDEYRLVKILDRLVLCCFIEIFLRLFVSVFAIFLHRSSLPTVLLTIVPHHPPFSLFSFFSDA